MLSSCSSVNVACTSDGMLCINRRNSWQVCNLIVRLFIIINGLTLSDSNGAFVLFVQFNNC